MEGINPETIFAMFKGEPGTRKSTQALSFPTPQYWLSWDRKMNGLMIPMKLWGIDRKLIEYDDYDNWDKPRTKLEQLQVNCKYKTIIADSITSMADQSIRQVLRIKGGGEKGKRIGGIQVAGVEDFNAESAALQDLVSILKDINSYHGCIVILIAHVIQADYRNTVTQETHVSRTIVTAAKKNAAKIPAYCSEVYHFNIKKGFDAAGPGEYSLLTEHTGEDFARTALPLPREIVFKDKPLYSNWIRPAIDDLKKKAGDF
jgi:hypothetical protein